MRLQTKVAWYYLLAAAFSFVACGTLSFYLIRHAITQDIDEHLLFRKTEISTMIPQIANIGSIGNSLVITKKDGAPSSGTIVSDTVLFDKTEGERLPFRQLVYDSLVNGALYHIIIRKSLIESEDLIDGILLAFSVVFGLFAIISLLINTIINKRLLKPFYRTLDLMNGFDLKTHEAFLLPKTSTTEFQSLNRILEKMTRKISDDYKNIREFTENASHEMQTPLAIIISRLESLLEGQVLRQDGIEPVRTALHSANRLARMNKGLLLLTRIECGTFSEVQSMNFLAEVESQLELCRELIEMKGITVQKSCEVEPEVKMNAALATVLVSTLINNAIVHNIENGFIRIATCRSYFTVENSGRPLTVEPVQLFERFKKNNQTSETLGLGLAIAKKICEENGFIISYDAIDDKHRISIRFELQN